MIYRLRRKFIRICTLSFLVVFVCMCGVLIAANSIRQNQFADTLADMIAENDGTMPRPGQMPDQWQEGPHAFAMPMDAETPFATRFFVVDLDEAQQPAAVHMEFVSTVTQDEALDYARKAVEADKTRGWQGEYRYKRYTNSQGQDRIVFVHAGALRSMTGSNILTIASVFLVSSLAVLILIVAISRRAVKPAAESYEKQKVFITNVNHELKTPLTLILTNIDIAQSEVGQNEWLEDIRSEGQRMAALVNQLVTLTRMDEDTTTAHVAFDLSSAIEDTACEFRRLAQHQDKALSYQVAGGVSYLGSESEIRQLAAILLDNAVKYCDPGGTITLTLEQRRRKHPVLRIENTYAAVDALELDRLFDRFYRSDPARTASGSFGIGLSIARSIAKRHHAEIRVANIKHQRIGFQVHF